MTVETLKRQIQAAASGGTFTLGAGDLGVAGAQALIADHFGGTLTVTGVQPGADGLSLSGTGSVDTLLKRPTHLWFSTDDAGVNLTGVLIGVESADRSLSTGLVSFAPGELPSYFNSVALALSARPEDGTD